MTENKRFTLEEFGDRCVAHDNGRPMNARQVVEFLNAYEDEDKQLKIQLCQLAKENEQLKQKLKEHETTLKGQSNSIYQLKKKNELKESIDRIDSLIHTQEDYLAWSIIYETLTDGKPLGYRLKM